MSRTGPAFVENEDELNADLELKVNNGELSEVAAEAFLDLYEFGHEIGDRVDIGGAKNANFEVKVDVHQGTYRGDPSVFTANVDGEVLIWPAMMPKKEDAMDDVPWEVADYKAYQRALCSLSEVRDSKAIDFQALVSNGELDEFKAVVQDFVDTCQERSADSA
ncbi:hypothetical protein [Halobacterium salinarum]|uniref:Uncharacterized protein n=1 Tax=Halobacterium salinarum (strain ATCC 33171 / DSM 3754 / JCM 8978 / NBRC 102687 / NCIMB 764 / 91-R6) TaxID=2597657 RepID=A0A4D6GWA7_HALS9|nr:hypothetical protein [Halobacterium salinarum]QCC44848.1 uncharacterized protein HBSAL_05915 [Halobacterium salinarum]TYO75571.1 hypothetical protein APQ99_01894 [Halobacterium salinarum DSM 3754]